MKLFQLFESKELATELLWFNRFISENDLETEIEVENDKLVVYHDEKELCKWDAAGAKRIRTKVLTDAFESRLYARHVLKGRFELGEPIIAKDAFNSRWYAYFVLKGRFELGEKAIATNPYQSRCYAEEVLKGRFELGEPVIATDSEQHMLYKKFLATLK